MKRIITSVALTVLLSAQALSAAPRSNTNRKTMSRSPIASVLQPNRSPLVTFRVLFNTGAAFDPKGKEGVASLTASMIAEGGSRSMTYEQLLEAMYPMATSFGWQVDKEMTVFTGTTHVDNLDKYYGLVQQLLLDPGFREGDFNRLKEEALNYLKVNLRQSNDEELGKEQLYNTLYAGTAYGHNNRGTVSSLEKLTLEDVREFYKNNYTQAKLVLGLAGGYPTDFVKRAEADFAKLPAGKASAFKLDKLSLASGTRVEIIKRDTRSTAFSLGFPVDVTRSGKDYAALAVAASYLGQHRSSNSYLYQRLREARGLNYGDYAYIEYFPRGMFQFEPDPNLGRSSQIFQIWIRPVEPQNGAFTLRAALYEYDKLVRDGLSKESFEATRDFLTKFNNILTATQDAQLGYALDSRYYKIGDYVPYMREQLSKLTLQDVNNAIKKYLKSDNMRVVVITKDAEAFRDTILGGKPTPIIYVSPKPKEITDEDKLIEAFKLNLKPEQVVIVPVETVFQ
ncbi:MAG: pitrilysin family protein [Pyrinomonadaceae bacterium]